MRVLVTGGLGFIGSNLVSYLQDHTDWDLSVLDDMSSHVVDDLEGVEVFQGSVTNKKDVDHALSGVDMVVHLAANCGVLRSFDDPLFDMNQNIRGTLRLLSSCKRMGVSRFVFASSNAVLGNYLKPLSEELFPRPVSPYGVSKLCGEQYARVFSDGMQVRVCRFSNVYGPGSYRKGSVIPLFIRQVIDDEELVVFGDGSQTRDFVFVDDVCQGVFRCLCFDETDFDVFQIGSGQARSVDEILGLLNNCFDKDIRVVRRPFRRGEVRHSVSDISKARKVLGFDPLFDVDVGVEKTVWSFLNRRCG